MNAVIAAGLGIIAVLASYAVYLHWLLRRHRRQERQVAVAGAGTVDPADPRVRQVPAAKGIYLLSEALIEEKLTHTEGSLRICSIAADLDDSAQFRREYEVFFRVAEATAHIPILDDWRALSREQQAVFDREREAVERRHEAAVLEAAQRIRRRYRETSQ